MPKDELIGKIKEAAGALTGKELLEHEGELQQRKADAAKEAKRLEERAGVETASTDLDARARKIEVEQQRIAAEIAAEDRDARIDTEEHHRLADADRRAQSE